MSPITVGDSAFQHIRPTATLPSVFDESPNDFECTAEFTAGSFAARDSRFFVSSRFWGAYDLEAYFPAHSEYTPTAGCSHDGMLADLIMQNPAPGYPNWEDPPDSAGFRDETVWPDHTVILYAPVLAFE